MAKSNANVPVTRAAATRADGETSATSDIKDTYSATHTISSDFKPTYPTDYKAYFVATTDEGDYKPGEIVRVVDINLNTANLSSSTSKNITVTVPAISYNIIVTNYNPATGYAAGNTITDVDESNTYDFTKSLPTSSSTLYLYGSTATTTTQSDGTTSVTNNGDFSSKTGNVTAYVTLDNEYAAVCVAANDFVSKVVYNGDATNYTNNSTTGTTGTTATNGNWYVGDWYYLYIKVTNHPDKFSSTLTIANINNYTGEYTINHSGNSNENYDLVANKIYEYRINDNFTGGTSNSNGLTVTVNPFTETKSDDISVY
jgi:hypothetical protein